MFMLYYDFHSSNLVEYRMNFDPIFNYISFNLFLLSKTIKLANKFCSVKSVCFLVAASQFLSPCEKCGFDSGH